MSYSPLNRTVWPFGESAMAARIRGFDWASTSLGNAEDWPSAIRIVVAAVIAHPSPMALVWGPDLTMLYNDAYRPLLGNKAEALGRPFLDVWSEARDVVSSQVKLALEGLAMGYQNASFVVLRGDQPEEAFFDYSHTPVRDEHGTILGLIITAVETTERVHADRKEAEAKKALHESETRLRALVTMGAHPVYRMSPDWQTMYRLESHRPMQASESVDDWVSKFILDEDRPHFFAAVEEAIRRRSQLEVEHRVRSVSGEIGWVFSRAVPLFDEHNEIIEWFGTSRDVTSRKLAEAALRESEEKYRDLYTSMGQGYIEIELVRNADGLATDYRYLSLNQAFERLTGVPVEKAIGRLSLEVIPGLSPFCVQTFASIVDLGLPTNFEYEERALDRWYGIYASPNAGDRLKVFALDITERKRAEAALRQSEENYRFLFENMTQGYAEIAVLRDANGDVSDYKITRSNPAYERVMGFSAKLSIDRAVMEILPNIDAWWLETVKRVANSGTPERFEREETILGLWLDVYVVPRDEDHLFVIFDNITERKRAEVELRAHEEQQRITLELVPATFWWADPQGNVVHADESWMEYTGQTAAEVHHFGWLKAIHPGDLDATRAAFMRAFATGEPLERQHRIWKKNEGYRWHLVRHFPLRDQNGVITRWFGAATDVHELHESQERQEFLLQLSDTLRSLDAAQAMMDAATTSIRKQLQASRAIYYENQGNSYVIQSDRVCEAPSKAGSRLLPILWIERLKKYSGSDFAIIVNDIADVHTPMECEEFAESQIAAYIGVTVWIQGRLAAGLWIHSSEPRVWSANEVAMAQEVADRTWASAARARAEEALWAGEEKYRRLFETIDQGYAEIEILRDRSGKVSDAMLTLVNSAYERQSGIPVEKLTWRPLLDVFPNVDPWWVQTYDTVAASGRPVRFERKLQEFDRWFDIHVIPRGKEHVLALFDDISQRKHSEQALRASEERFRLLVENVREYALVQTDLEGTVTSWNPGAERLFGYTSQEIVGQTFARLLPEADRRGDVMGREMSELLLGKKKNAEVHLVQRNDGSQFWAEWITEPVLDDQGKLRGTAKVMRDESERRKADTALRRSLREKEELLKEVHHRVKNNLQVITSLLNLQAETLHDQHTLAHFQEARNRVQSISVIHELLYKSASFASVSLCTYAERLLPSLVHFYGLQSRVSTSVSGDRVTIELERAVPFGLLLNELLSNALKHAFPDGRNGLVEVNVYHAESEIILKVSDTGVGLPADLYIKQSASLGLKLVGILVRQLQGKIEFVPGPGSVCKVSFPEQTGSIKPVGSAEISH